MLIPLVYLQLADWQATRCCVFMTEGQIMELKRMMCGRVIDTIPSWYQHFTSFLTMFRFAVLIDVIKSILILLHFSLKFL